MSQASSLLNTVNAILRKNAPMDRTAYKRLKSASSATEDLLGRYSSTPTFTDTLLDPQPYYGRVSRESISGGSAESHTLNTGSSLIEADDYEFILSPSAISKLELVNPNMTLVLENELNQKEEFRFLDVVPSGVNGADVLFVAYFRSLNRPASQ
jgi:hypothetical protein